MELTNIDDYFQTSISNQSSENILKECISNIVSKNVKLEEIISSLEPYLTSKDNFKRAKSIKFVSELVKHFRSSRFNSLEIDYLSTYLCSKLDDHYSVSTAALPGLHSLLIKCQPISENELSKNSISAQVSIKILKTTLNTVHVQSMGQADRFTVYDMCKFVLSSPRLVQQIKTEKYETDFVYGFIQSMDGEKDPRNLLICFECIRLICSQMNLGPFVDETFEVFACYFPIDFTPLIMTSFCMVNFILKFSITTKPKNDNFLITKQMLIESLRLCFSSTTKFCKNTIPLLLEKLDSSVEDAQLDALDTYSECANSMYDPNEYKEYLETLWNQFHKISMNATKNNLEEAALNAIHSMAKSLSKTIQNANSNSSVSIEWFVQKVLDSCLAYLEEPDLKLVWPNVKCLLSIASSSSTANLLILKNTLPSILLHYNSTNFQKQKKTYLDILWQFVSNSLKFDSKASDVLKENIDTMLKICLENESNKHLRFQCLNGFYYLIKFDNLVKNASKLDETDISNYETIAKKLWHSLWVSSCENDHPTAKEERSRLIEIFYILLKNNAVILKWFFKSLEESIVESRTEGTQGYVAGFDLIESLTSQYAKTDENEFFFGSEHLLNLFQKLIVDLNGSDENSEYLSCLFDSLSQFFQNLKLKEQNEPNLVQIQFKIIENLLDLVLSEQFDNIFKQNWPNYSALIIKCSLVFKSFSSSLRKTALSDAFLKKINDLYLNNPNFTPFEAESNVDQKKKLIFYMQTIVSLNKMEFKSDYEEIFKKIEPKLRNLSLNENDEINQITCQFYAALLNKLDNNQTDSYVNMFREQLEQNIENSENQVQNRIKCIKFWIWIDKALTLKEHRLYEAFTKKLIDWLDDSDLGKVASEGFGTILNDDPKETFVLTHTSVSNVRKTLMYNVKLFYRQRFFNFVVEPLKNKFESKENVHIKQRLYYALSVLNMVSLLSKEIIQKQLKSMLPILLFSLSSSVEMEEKLCLSSLKSFEMLLNDSTRNDDNSFIPYLQDILEKLVSMTKIQRSLEIRLLALNCLNIIALNLPPNELIKHQKYVCKQLEKCLTDKKRLCRQLAVEARNRWFLLTTKNSE